MNKEQQQKVTHLIMDLMNYVDDDDYDDMEYEVNKLYAELGWGYIVTVKASDSLWSRHRKIRMKSWRFRYLYYWHKWKLWAND